MAENKQSVRGKSCKQLERSLLRRGTDFQKFKERVRGLEPSTLGGMLGALADLSTDNAGQAAIVGALVSGAAIPSHTRFCVDVVCWAFTPYIERKLQTLRRSDKTDAAQACMLGLLEAASETQTIEDSVTKHLTRGAFLACGADKERLDPCLVGAREGRNRTRSGAAAENVIARMRKGIDLGFAQMARSERRAAKARQNLKRQAQVLVGSDVNGRRAPRKQRIRFDERERGEAQALLQVWISNSKPTRGSLDAWISLVLNGESVRGYLKRTQNTDREATALECARISNAKARAGKKIREIVRKRDDVMLLRRSLDIRDLFNSGV